MGHVKIYRLLLCAIVVASASEHSRLRTVVPSAPHGIYCSADSDETKFDNFELQAMIAGQPFVYGADELSYDAPVTTTILIFDSPQRNASHLRGPPRFCVS